MWSSEAAEGVWAGTHEILLGGGQELLLRRGTRVRIYQIVSLLLSSYNMMFVHTRRKRPSKDLVDIHDCGSIFLSSAGRDESLQQHMPSLL